MRKKMSSRPKKTVGQRVKQSWDRPQIEKEQKEEERDWQEEDQMEVQWAEDGKLEESLERRRMEGFSLQAEVVQKIPESVVHERMSQGERRQGHKRKEVSERVVY